MSAINPRNRLIQICLKVFKSRNILFLVSLLVFLYLYYFDTCPNKQENGSYSDQNFHHYLEYKQDDWQSVGNSKFKFWIYSAYSFGSGQVTIIGSSSAFLKENEHIVHCAFYFSSGSTNISNSEPLLKTVAFVERMRGWVRKVSGSFIRCPLPTNTLRKPEFVSVLLPNQNESPARLPIKYQTLSKNGHRPYEFSVCVLPLYGYNDVFHFLEWLEFYKMMGAQHFTFYNRSIGPATSCIMNHYQNSQNLETKVKVKPWHGYPQKKDKTIRMGHGISAGLNDCWYSHRGLTKYMIFVDVDEFIVPEQGSPNYKHLIDYIEKNSINNEGSEKTGEYVFRNGFYVKTRPIDGQLLDRCGDLRDSFPSFHACQHLLTMQYVVRNPLLSFNSRTKYIGVPEAIRCGGNHYTFEFEKGWKGRKVEGDVAVSRHYRIFSKARKPTVERMPLDLGIELARNVAERIDYFMKVCNLSMANVYK